MVKIDKARGLEDLPPRLSIHDAAEVFDVAEKTIRRWIADGTLVAYRLRGRTIRVDRDSLIAMQKPMGPYYGS